jgi:hypothetical protein
VGAIQFGNHHPSDRQGDSDWPVRLEGHDRLAGKAVQLCLEIGLQSFLAFLIGSEGTSGRMGFPRMDLLVNVVHRGSSPSYFFAAVGLSIETSGRNQEFPNAGSTPKYSAT